MKIRSSIIELFYISHTELMRQPFKKLRDYQDIVKLIRWHGSNENPPLLKYTVGFFQWLFKAFWNGTKNTITDNGCKTFILKREVIGISLNNA